MCYACAGIVRDANAVSYRNLSPHDVERIRAELERLRERMRALLRDGGGLS